MALFSCQVEGSDMPVVGHSLRVSTRGNEELNNVIISGDGSQVQRSGTIIVLGPHFCARFQETLHSGRIPNYTRHHERRGLLDRGLFLGVEVASSPSSQQAGNQARLI